MDRVARAPHTAVGGIMPNAQWGAPYPQHANATHSGEHSHKAALAVSLSAHVESPGGLSPPGAPSTVRERLDSYGSPMSGRCHGIDGSERGGSEVAQNRSATPGFSLT